MHRYSNIEYVLNLDFSIGLELIQKAQEQQEEERHFLQWVVQLPNMGKDNFMSFAEYRERLTGANIDTRPTDELLAEIEAIEAEFKGQ